jgi:HK97 family phage portal protein
MPTLGDRFRKWVRRKPQESKKVSALQPTWETMQPQYATEGDFATLVKEGYHKNELIYACITAKAKTAQQISLQVLDQEGEPFEEHPLLDLIHRPNDYMNESDFWAAVTIYQALAGRAVFEIEYANRGTPIALWPLRPDWVSMKQRSDRPAIDYYEYTVPGRQAVMLKPEQVLDFPLFDPLDRFKTYPPVLVAGRVGDVDNAATDLIKLIFENGGMPLGYLKTTQVIADDAIIEEIQKRWSDRYGGWKNWIKPAVLDRDADYQRLTMNLDDEMGFGNLDGRNEARICAVLDVPPILVGAKVGLEHGTYSNYETARRAWWEDTVLAMYANYLDVLEYKLLPMYPGSEGLSIGWDTAKVYAFSENENEAWKRATDAWNANAITLAQFCEEVGLGEPDDEMGEKYKNQMTTPPALAQANPFATKPSIAEDKPADNAEQQEAAQMSDEMENDRQEEEIKQISALLAEIKAIRAEMKVDGLAKVS